MHTRPPFHPPSSAQSLVLERRLPYDIRAGLNVVTVHRQPATLTEAGVEGLTFAFRWEENAGHHLVRRGGRAGGARLARAALLWRAGTPARRCRRPSRRTRCARQPMLRSFTGCAALPSQERGWNSVDVVNVRDCWVKNIGSVNGDSTVLIAGAAVGGWGVGLAWGG